MHWKLPNIKNGKSVMHQIKLKLVKTIRNVFVSVFRFDLMTKSNIMYTLNIKPNINIAHANMAQIFRRWHSTGENMSIQLSSQ